ncbi:hypothetical protein SH139x_004451 [Planctomycetaceae bacterium SH139]
MSAINGVPANVSKLLDTAYEKSKTDSQIAYAVAGKQMKASQAAGDSAVKLVEQAANMQQQLSQGRLDVRV